MSYITEVGTIAIGYLVPEQIDDEDTWVCIRDVSIIDGIICCYTEFDDYAGLMINNKKEEDWELVEFDIANIYKERLMWNFLETESV